MHSICAVAVQSRGGRQRSIEAPASFFHHIIRRSSGVSFTQPITKACGAARSPSLTAFFGHVSGVPACDVGREVVKRQTKNTALSPAARSLPEMFPADTVHDPGPGTLDRIISTPRLAEDLTQHILPEGVPGGARHDRVTHKGLRLLLQEHRMHEVFFTQEHGCRGRLRSAQQGLQGLCGFDVDVGINSAHGGKSCKARNIGALDARHAVILSQVLGEPLCNELATGMVIPELEPPAWVLLSPRGKMACELCGHLVRLPGLVKHARYPEGSFCQVGAMKWASILCGDEAGKRSLKGRGAVRRRRSEALTQRRGAARLRGGPGPLENVAIAVAGAPRAVGWTGLRGPWLSSEVHICPWRIPVQAVEVVMVPRGPAKSVAVAATMFIGKLLAEVAVRAQTAPAVTIDVEGQEVAVLKKRTSGSGKRARRGGPGVSEGTSNS
mmetsp:Transcript_22303/g.51658  ORF Transcript_22303/g.51658 Transcript_22303/m.51658 type:complete len:439 (-) Transcript_22303:237-1553(-)